MSGMRLQAVEEESVERFAHEVLLGLADLESGDLDHGNLTLALGLSLWMRRGRIGVDAARDALLDLRAALVRASGLDERTEPVPLLLADPVAAIVSLARYMDGLLHRAARTAATSRLDMARRALALVVD
ncbi:MAG TPA: hypothetical protein VN820_06675 [Acidimicrobiales bacterium]|nr:hypothetical protein [Acidimicrobiales bacterium]